MSERSTRFRPTPGLKRKVKECMDKLVAEGFQLTPGVYVQDTQCCALGAISVCEKRPEGAEFDDEDTARRSGTDSFALSLQHLGCSPWELESIEAGFEGWPMDIVVQKLEEWRGCSDGDLNDILSAMDDCGDGANMWKATATRRVQLFQRDAWLLGQWVYETYVTPLNKERHARSYTGMERVTADGVTTRHDAWLKARAQS